MDKLKDKVDQRFLTDFDDAQNRAYLKLFPKTNSVYQHFAKGQALIKLIIEQYDPRANQYLSPNSFRRFERKQVALGMLQAFWLDLDVEKMGYDKQDICVLLPSLITTAGLPYPTHVVDSGHGLYLIWKIEPRPVYSGSIVKLWGHVEQTIAEKFDRGFNHVFESDKGIVDHASLDPTRVLRIPGTINPKHGEQRLCQVIARNDHVYTLFGLSDKLLPLTHDEYVQKMQQNTRHKHHSSNVSIEFKYKGFEQRLLSQRVSDINTLVQVRKGQMTNCREVSLFLLANSLGQITDVSRVNQAINQLNSRFADTLPDSEIRALKAEVELLNIESHKPDAKRNWYRYKNETMIRLLHITDNEARGLQTLLTPAEKQRRRKQYSSSRSTMRRQNNQNRIEKRNRAIFQLISQGLTRKQVASKVGVSSSTVARALRLHR